MKTAFKTGLKNIEPAKLTYKQAGVDITAGNEVVSRIQSLVESTNRPEVMSNLGGFSGLFALLQDLPNPILVSSTDGVGTKLKIAFLTGLHNTVGIDLVAMCVNDIITTGAKPLFFLDYFATGLLKPQTAHQVIAGIAEGCRQAGCALLGGETAEMPGFYSPGEYDLAGFSVGLVARDKIVTGEHIKAGDRVVGIASSGLHSNGYSLVRKSLLEVQGLSLESKPPELTRTLGEELLVPTRIYTQAVESLMNQVKVKGLAHITGGGLIENPPRILPDGLGVKFDPSTWEIPPIFELVARAGIEKTEMRKTFNMGIGMIAVIASKDVDKAIQTSTRAGETVWDIGEIISIDPESDPVVFKND
jgi:phosphoribosylformylglycinamidine cyclo-ligase